jgi:hypothetical protein
MYHLIAEPSIARYVECQLILNVIKTHQDLILMRFYFG